MNKKIALIDLGSNTIRLLIYELIENSAYRLIDVIKQPIRLIENMIDGKYINDFSMHKSIKTIKLLKKLCLSYNIPTQNIFSIITSSINTIANRHQFLEMLNKTSGLEFKVLSNEEEATFISMGVKNSIKTDDALIINISGGHTQIIQTNKQKVTKLISIPIGSVNATERYLNTKNFNNLKTYLISELTKYEWLQDSKTIICVGGLVRTLSKIIINKTKYPLKLIHNFEFEVKILYELFDEISDFNQNEINNISGMSIARADIFYGGLFILSTITKYLKSSQIKSCSCGLREGLIFNHLINNFNINYTNMFEFSLNNLLINLKITNLNNKFVRDISLSLFNQLKPIHNLDIAEENLLNYSALLYSIGLNISYHNHCDHTFNLLTNSNIYGLSHREIILLSAISASYRSNSFEDKYLKNYSKLLKKDDMQIYRILSIILKLAERFTKSKIRIIEAIDCKIYIDSVKIKIIHNGDAELEINLANDLADVFFKAFNKKLIIT